MIYQLMLSYIYIIYNETKIDIDGKYVLLIQHYHIIINIYMVV